jgi:hypothetical protein
MAIGNIKGLRSIFDLEKARPNFRMGAPSLFIITYGQQGMCMPQHAPSAQQAAVRAPGVAANAVVAVRERPITAIFAIRIIMILHLNYV